ncbi:PAS domain S-box-containing protein [Marinospirillum celere]|uniref:histidine kinase n=1 Tax=Marinospirillum celere TaxID=1122252 RepID=A0A1I1DYM6_9GAMM|nr:PAS domain-containing protein [Marinospirillum celere]SFB79502.1 PAS domain S-box-containing protein [Marinospirillum celere]
MLTPPTPKNEHERQRALNESCLLDSGAEPRFDRITRLARQAFSIPIVLVSLIDRDRQWFKSRQGLDAEETSRNISFCGHTILTRKPFIVENALEDSRFADNPLVTGAPNIRFYAGAAIYTSSGYPIGTLCLIDTKPRSFSDDQTAILLDYAAMVEELVQADEFRRRAASGLEAELLASQDEMASLIENLPGVTFRCLADEHWSMLYIGGKVSEITGYTPEDLIDNKHITYASLIHPDDTSRVYETVTQAMTDNFEWRLEYRIQHRDGVWRWVEEHGKCVNSNTGLPQVLEGFIVDITREHNTASQLSQHQDALVLLNEVAFTKQESLDTKIDYALSVAREYMQSDMAILSQIDGEVYIARWVNSKAGTVVEAGQRFSLDQTWCQLLVSKERIKDKELYIANTEDPLHSELFSHPCYQANPLGSYAGIVIEVEGKPFGTLNFSSSQARAEAFTESEQLFVRLLAHWLADTLTQSLVNERLTKLMAQLPGVTYQFRRYLNGHMTFPFSSPQIQSLYGLTPKQAAEDASPALQCIHPDDMGFVAESIEHSANTLEYWQATYRVRQANKGYRWIIGQAKPERLADGSTLWHGYLQDIHQQEESRLALEQNEARLRGLFEFSPIGIALNDFETGKFIDLNDALLAPTGYTRDEFTSLSYWDVTPKEYAPEEEKALASMIARGRYGPFEKEYIRKDGSRYPVRLQGMVSQEKDGRKVIWSLIEDISERRKLEKMKDQFIATVSHELRTPLTSISGSLLLLIGGAAGSLPDKAKTLLSTADRNAQRLTALINDLLDMEKLVAGKMPMHLTSQPLAPLIGEAVDSMNSYALQHQVGVRYSKPLPTCQVNVDGQRLIQALTNLLSNAIKFSPKTEFVELKVQLKEAQVEIAVRDKGPGVDPLFRHQLFKRFSQADSSDTRKLPGSGLGLAITREICQQLDGKVGYRDAKDGGGEFFILLPREAS